jgi:hypothetical protein
MKNLIILFGLFILQSCSVTGVTNDYKKLNDGQKAMIVDLDKFENLDKQKIYKINGAELRAELPKYEKALVYVFKNGCTSDYCKPLIVYHLFAERNGYKLFLVMNGYCNLNQSLEAPYEGPLFSIDNDHYNISSRNKYIRYFENDMLGKPLETKAGEYLGNLYFFNKGVYEKTLRDLPNG